MDLSNISVNTQSSIRIAGSKVLYFDPFQVSEERHDADAVFITHEHYDHFEPESIAKVCGPGTILAAPASLRDKVLEQSGIPEDRCVFFIPGDAREVEGLRVQAVPAYNRLKPFHPKGKKWVGYLVEMDDVTYYVAGDTDAQDDIRSLSCDVALIPIGGHFTMDRKQAADLICSMKPKAVIPTHYGSIVGNATDGSDFRKLLEEKAPGIQVELKL